MDDELITERRPVAFPQVFGYLRHITGGHARHAALVECLTEYCRRHELTLGGVFTDRDATVAIRSAAFVGLVDALQLTDTYGVIVPALSHLGPKGIGAERRRQITASSTRLLVVRSFTPTRGSEASPGTGAGVRPRGTT
ncbi:hypothetical protein ABZ915_36475 [Streptomyces sp. NPDC046915]|uniref:hypothetical protein n=1 Tax=Streptomyces sp. NPDC046915 TaxID=3155257 RepID=UPI0033C556C3